MCPGRPACAALAIVQAMPEPAGAERDPRETRAMRGLVPFEIAAVLAVAIAPLPDAVPVALPLVALASASRWLRRRSWAEQTAIDGRKAAVSFGAGLAALAIALVIGTPLVEHATDRAVQWSAFPVVRGHATQLALVAMVVVAMAIAGELALRGWIVERVAELSPGPAVLPVLVGAIAEGVVTPGELAVRIGAGAFGAGLGWIYVAAGRSVVAPICARIAFGLGAVTLEALRVIG